MALINPLARPQSVKERIERQMLRVIAQITGSEAANVQRYDETGNRPVELTGGGMPAAWFLVTFQDEEIREEDAAIGMEEMSLPFVVDVHLVRKSDADKSWAEHGNAWVAVLKRGLMEQVTGDGPYWPEAGSGKGLIMDLRLRATFGPDPEAGQRERIAGVEGEILYRHPLADPYSVG